MSRLRLLLAMAIIAVFMVLSAIGHAETTVKNHYSLNTDVQTLLVDKSSPAECYSKAEFSGDWIRVVCESDVTPHFLYWLELRLSYIGILDTQDIFTEGVRVGLNERLYNAIETFQQSKGLAISGLSYETINVLSGIDMRVGSKVLGPH